MSLDPLVEEPDAGSEVFPYSTNQSDHVYPSIVIVSSEFLDVTFTFFDDFTSYADQSSADLSWIPIDSALARVNITNDNLDFNYNNQVLNKSIAHDLGSPTDDNQGKLRFKIRFSALTQAVNAVLHIMVSDLNQATGITTIQDLIGIAIINAAGLERYRAFHSDHGALTFGTIVNLVWAISTDYFFEIERLSSISLIVRRYSDATYTTVLDSSTLAIPATIIGLRYLKLSNTMDGVNGGQFQGTIDDVDFTGGIRKIKEHSIDNNVATYWQSNSELNPFLRGEFSALADKEPAQIAIYVDKSKITSTQFLIQTSPDAITWTTKRTINVSQLTTLQYNFIRFNRDIFPIRYIRLIGNDSIPLQFAITEFKALIPDAIQWADRQARKTISTTGIVGLSG